MSAHTLAHIYWLRSHPGKVTGWWGFFLWVTLQARSPPKCVNILCTLGNGSLWFCLRETPRFDKKNPKKLLNMYRTELHFTVSCRGRQSNKSQDSKIMTLFKTVTSNEISKIKVQLVWSLQVPGLISDYWFVLFLTLIQHSVCICKTKHRHTYH